VRCDLGGQPDSVAASPDGRYLAVAIENERDEDLDDGVIPSCRRVISQSSSSMPTAGRATAAAPAWSI
jgi:hypothetical protein